MRRAIVLLLVSLAACSSSHASKPPSTGVLEENATLDRVVDGDTIDVRIDGSTERVRLIGIDTPETKKPNTPVQCYGPEATANTKHLLPEGTPLRLVRDVQARDDYGRLLAYVYRADDGTFVNLQIVAQGYAHTLTIPPNVAFADQFVAAARDAEHDNLGLWSACTG